MKILKKYDFIWKFVIFILLLTLTLTIINLIIPLKENFNSLISLIAILLYSLIVGIKKGMVSEKKAYKEGFKLGIINIIVLYILGLITLNFSITIKKLLYFLIIVITTILGSIIGINKKNSR